MLAYRRIWKKPRSWATASPQRETHLRYFLPKAQYATAKDNETEAWCRIGVSLKVAYSIIYDEFGQDFAISYEVAV